MGDASNVDKTTAESSIPIQQQSRRSWGIECDDEKGRKKEVPLPWHMPLKLFDKECDNCVTT